MGYSRYIKAGNFLEVYDYKVDRIKSKRKYSNFKDWNKSMVDPESVKNDVSYLMAKNRIRRLVNCNFTGRSSFLTLTYANNFQDVEGAKKDFVLFIKRLNYALYGSKISTIKYLAVYELQERGAIHFHIVLFDVPFIDIDVLRKVWSYGVIKINKIGQCDNVGAYICKYFTKDSLRKKNQKLFFRSFNLIEPLLGEVSQEDMRKIEMASGVSQLRYMKNYKDYFGSDIQYRQLKTTIDTSLIK